MDAADQQAETGAGRDGREIPERRPALEHRVGRGADAADLEEVVHDPDRVEADLVGVLRDTGEGRADLGVAAGPRERADLQSDLHRAEG